MKVDVKDINDVTKELSFEISKERVSEKLEEVYKDLGKVANVKGFRKGKVPRHVLEAKHGKLAEEEVIKKLIPEVYQEGVAQNKLSPIDMPQIENVSFKDGVITFLAKVELKPEVTIKDKDYKGIKVKRKSVEVSDDEVNKTLEYLKAGRGKDGEVAIDDAFARGMGYPSLEDFKKTLVRQMEIDKDRRNQADVENQIIESLLKKAKLTTPPSLVKRQLEHRIEENKKRLKSQGITDEDIAKKDDEMRKELSEAVEKDVRVYLVLDKIAQLENIEIQEGENSPAKVIEFLLKEAKWEGEK